MKKILIAIMFITVFSSCNKEKGNERLNPNSMIAVNAGAGVKSDNPEHLTAKEIIRYSATFTSRNFTAGGLGVMSKQRDLEHNRILMLSDQIINSDGTLQTVWIEDRDIILQRFRKKIAYLNKILYYPTIAFRLDRENRKVIVGDIVYANDDIDQLNPIFEKQEELPYPDDFIPNEDTDGGFQSLYCETITRDTVAYIPNAIMREAEKKITEAYAAGDYATCYELFDNAISFYPITGAEWRALKEQGIE